jgi:hypothetical protein
MCEIKKGMEVYLLKGGLVKLPDGSVYALSDCSFTGGKIILGIGEYVPPRPKKKVIKVNGIPLLEEDHIDFGDYNLRPVELVLNPIKEPEPEPPVSYTLPFALIGAGLLFALKKISGLDRKLKTGSCEVRHQEAIVRIAKLEGKVLRKQVMDGGKKIKEKFIDKKEEDET